MLLPAAEADVGRALLRVHLEARACPPAVRAALDEEALGQVVGGGQAQAGAREPGLELDPLRALGAARGSRPPTGRPGASGRWPLASQASPPRMITGPRRTSQRARDFSKAILMPADMIRSGQRAIASSQNDQGRTPVVLRRRKMAKPASWIPSAALGQFAPCGSTSFGLPHRPWSYPLVLQEFTGWGSGPFRHSPTGAGRPPITGSRPAGGRISGRRAPESPRPRAATPSPRARGRCGPTR